MENEITTFQKVLILQTRLLKELAPDEEKYYSEGAEEVEEVIGKLKSNPKE